MGDEPLDVKRDLDGGRGVRCPLCFIQGCVKFLDSIDQSSCIARGHVFDCPLELHRLLFCLEPCYKANVAPLGGLGGCVDCAAFNFFVVLPESPGGVG